jgi:hypothetical protein
MTMETRSIRLGRRRVPVILPNRRDARLHTASVIISIHVIGITALAFEVSVPQILSAMVTAGVIDVALTLRQTGKLVWPASGMLTGSGVALIMRLVGMGPGEFWSWRGWYWFAVVSGVSVLTKHVIRLGGSHVFNPSNIGLVVAFLVLGPELIEPLDFWWAPLGPWMVIAYAVIIVGGILITRRLYLLEMAIVFWAVLAFGLAILAGSGHCMIATWSTTPVCDGRFWGALVTSPEVLIFMFFMITDPKTVPEGRAGRVTFSATVGLLATLLIAPSTTEFWAKVGLLSSLALCSPMRLLFDRLTEIDGVRSGVIRIGKRLTAATPATTFTRGLALGAALTLATTAILVAGGPARQPAVAAASTEIDVAVDVSEWPEVNVDRSVEGLDIVADDAFVAELTRTFAENLEIEAEAVRTVDGSLLGLSDGGERLDVMQARLDEAIATGIRIVDTYTFSELSLRLHEAPEGQSSAGLVFSGRGRVDHLHYDPDGNEIDRTSEDFDLEFVLRQLGGERWVLVAVVPAGD